MRRTNDATHAIKSASLLVLLEDCLKLVLVSVLTMHMLIPFHNSNNAAFAFVMSNGGHYWNAASSSGRSAKKSPRSGRMMIMFQSHQVTAANRRMAKCTKLNVSEIHIPAYRTTKLPFILNTATSVETRGNDESNILTLTKEELLPPLVEQVYTNEDYVSMIPYQDGHLVYTTIEPLLTPQECQLIIDEAEKRCEQIGWTTSRHGNYPTTDIPAAELADSLMLLKNVLHERIYPLMRHQFRHYLPDGKKLRVADGFVVKYDAEGGQKELKPHRDGSVLSFNIALNPSNEYTGGGTWFHSLNDAVKLEQGQIVTHASALLHGGHGITLGKRYVLVCFVILEGYDQWSMRFYNEVRNK